MRLNMRKQNTNRGQTQLTTGNITVSVGAGHDSTPNSRATPDGQASLGCCWCAEGTSTSLARTGNSGGTGWGVVGIFYPQLLASSCGAPVSQTTKANLQVLVQALGAAIGLGGVPG